eukprot:6976874-Ditylum_brightwellii.AAC.1
MSRVHPGNWSKNYPTSLQPQDTQAVSHEGAHMRQSGLARQLKLPEGHPRPGWWRMKSPEGD